MQAAIARPFGNIDRLFRQRRITLVLDWDTYKQLCDTPGTFSRWMLEQTMELLEGGTYRRLSEALEGEPLGKPGDHRGGAPTDMFILTLSQHEAAAIAARVVGAAANGETTSGTRQRGLGGFQEAWLEYAQSLGQVRVL